MSDDLAKPRLTKFLDALEVSLKWRQDFVMDDELLRAVLNAVRDAREESGV